MLSRDLAKLISFASSVDVCCVARVFNVEIGLFLNLLILTAY